MRYMIKKHSIYFMLGFTIFELIILVTQKIVLYIFGLNKNIIELLYKDIFTNIFIYSIIYIIMSMGIYIFDKIYIKKLNEKLTLLKERKRKDE